MRSILIILGSVFALALCASIANAQQAPEHRWDLVLSGFFSEGQNPLSVYARERGNQWISAVGSSVVPGSRKYSFNKSYHYIDFSKTPIVNGVMKGAATVYLTPDLWVPSKHQTIPVTIDVDAKVLADGKIAGNYIVTKIDSDDPAAQSIGKGGMISGTSKDYTPAPLPAEVTFDVKLQGAQVGGKDAFGERCLVARLGFRDGKLVTAARGGLSQKDAVYGVTAFRAAADAVSINGDSFSGRLVIPMRTLDEIPCTYTITVNGRLMETFLVGTYQMSVAIEGGQTITRTGSFDGKWSQGVQIVTFGGDELPWWTPVKDFKPVQAGEHPRLLFRKADLPALRARFATPEGQAIIQRLKAQLGGGEAMPTVWNPSTAAYQYKGKPLPLGAYTIGHAAGFGFLYQMTGDKKYADLAKECFEWAFKGIRDADDRYSWVKPGGALRAGVVIGWYALAYDLAYDGWDDATRQRIGKAIAEYNAGAEDGDARSIMDIETLVRGTQPPGSNHFGMQVGGAAMALLAVLGDPGIDNTRIERLLRIGEVSMVRNLSEGFGDGGFFSEGDGTGSMSSQHNFIEALACWRNVKGMDWVNVQRPNVRMLGLRWIYQTIAANGRPDFWPIRGAYGGNVWQRSGMSGAGYFAQGFAALPEDQKAAMLWYYNHFFAEADAKAGMPFDTASDNPQYTVCAFVNWPFGMQEKNPTEVLPLIVRDSRFDFYLWRNRWQDRDDIVISLLPKVAPGGNYAAKAEIGLSIAAYGQKINRWGNTITGDVKSWWTSPKGEASVLTMANGTSLAVDFTKASGADGMLVVTGQVLREKIGADRKPVKGADGKVIMEVDGIAAKVGNTDVTIKFLLPATATAPEVKTVGDTLVIGKQIVSMKDGALVLGVTTK